MKRFTNFIPRLVFCALGNWENFDTIKEVVNKAGFVFDDDYSILENDDRMVASFTAFADRVNYSMKDEEWADIGKHKAVAYFCAPETTQDDDLKNIAGKALMLIKYLFNNLGVVALKCESTAIAHGRDRWIDLSEKYTTATDHKDDYLYQAYVRRPLESETGYYSCGMHILGYPDVLYSVYGEDELVNAPAIDHIAKIIMSYNGDFEQIKEELEGYESSIELIPSFHEEDSFQSNPYGLVSVEAENNE